VAPIARRRQESGRSPLGRLVEWAIVILVVGASGLVLIGLRREARASGFTTIDTRRSRLELRGRWVDPRWEEILAHRVAVLGPVDCEDAAGVERVVAAIAGLAFVRVADEPTVLWPDGLRVPVQVADVVACARLGRHFQPIAADGTVLPGLWPSPPPAGTGFLPVIGPLDADWRGLRAGDRIEDPAALRALDVAASMWSCLDPRDLERLGRIVIDAREAQRTSPAVAGTRLLLEEGREVLFGRHPSSGEPGELPAELKWRAVSDALELLARGVSGVDWEVADVRWDRPEIGPRRANSDGQ